MGRSGIYRWTVDRPGKTPLVYIGQAGDLDDRINSYLSDWRTKSDRTKLKTNERLWNAVRKYGEQVVSYDVIERVSERQLTERETYWYDRYLSLEAEGKVELANFFRPVEPPMRNPQIREKQKKAAAEFNRALWADDDWRNARTEGARRTMTELNTDPDFRRKGEEGRAAYWTEERRQQQAERMKARQADPEKERLRRERISAARRKRSGD